MTHFSMRSRIERKKNHVPCLLFKIEIAPALTFSIQTSHFNNAMHRFALVLCMPPVCDLCPEFKEAGSLFILWWVKKKRAICQTRFHSQIEIFRSFQDLVVGYALPAYLDHLGQSSSPPE